MKTIKRIICCIFLSFSMLFIGIGYASLTRDFEIKGIVSANVPSKVFITSASPKNQTNASLTSSTYTGTVLNSSMVFNPSNGNSQLVYEIVFYNGSDLIYEFESLTFPTYSNQNVQYLLTGLYPEQEIEPKTFFSCQLTFTSNVPTTFNVISNFNFIVSNTEDNVGLFNHESLIDAMLNDPTNGLNNADSYLNEQIAARIKGKFLLVPSRDTLGSMAIDQGNSLEIMFGDSYAVSEEISFIIQFVDTNNDKVADYYYIFTTSVNLGEKKAPSIAIGQPIYSIYRTKISYDNVEGKWVSEETVEGYAPSRYYEESQPDYRIHTSQIPAFDHDNWQPGRLGTTFDNAIWTTVNQSSLICCEAISNVEKRYYRINIPANTSYTLIIDGDNETNANDILFELYNGNRNLLSTSNASLTFPTSGSQTTYYFTMSGSTTMDFKLDTN